MRDLIESVLRLSWSIPMLGIRAFTSFLSSAMAGQTRNSWAGRPQPAPIPHREAQIHQNQSQPFSSSSPISDGRMPLAGESNNAIDLSALRSSGPVTGSGALNTSRLMVLGEGLAAGVGDFALTAENQIWSFPAQ